MHNRYTYCIFLDGKPIAFLRTKTMIGGNDQELVSLAMCSEYNASISRVKCKLLSEAEDSGVIFPVFGDLSA